MSLALRRLCLIAALVAAWCVYALRGSSGLGELKLALAKKTPAKPGTASVSWIKGGAPLDAAALSVLRSSAPVSGRAGD